MRIVHVVTRSHRRGAEVVAIELADHLDAKGHSNQLVALCLAQDGAEDARLPPLVRSVATSPLTLCRAGWRLRRTLARRPADIVVAHGGWAAQVVAFGLSAPQGHKVWQRILGFPDRTWRGLRAKYWSGVAHRFEAVVVLDAHLQEEMRRLRFHGEICRIPNARDPARFARLERDPASAELHSELGLPTDEPIIGFVGHLVAQKQPELAVEVLAAMRDLGTRAHLVIAGDGPKRASVQARVEHHGLQSSVTLMGHRDDPESIYAAVDLILITSAAEGTPGVAIEALMSGCPVITFDVGSVTDVIEDGVTGVVVPRPDVTLMADAAARLLGEPAAQLAMSAAGRRRSELFSTARTASMYEDCFRALAGIAAVES